MIGIGHRSFRAEGQPREQEGCCQHGSQGQIPGQVDPTRPHVTEHRAGSALKLISAFSALALVGIPEQKYSEPRPPGFRPPPHELDRSEQLVERIWDLGSKSKPM